MADPPVLKVKRPFSTVSEYIEEEGWTITPKGMLLIGQRNRKKDSVVRFELLLESGERVLRAEGKVLEYSKQREDRPGGLKVRFRRYDAKSKDFIDRVAGANQRAARIPSERPRRPMVSLPDGDDLDSVPSNREMDETAPPARLVSEQPGNDESAGEAREDDGGVRRVSSEDIEPPKNREELLARLRDRCRKPTKVRDIDDEADEGVG